MQNFARRSRLAYSGLRPARRLGLAALALPLLLWGGVSRLEATDYYVSATGNDANPGTSARPWRTITKVNSVAFNPGDRILFQGGATFAGGLYFDRLDDGLPTKPIVVSSYGTGRATVRPGNGTGMYVYNTAGYVVSNLVFSGSGPTLNKGDGLAFRADLPGNVKLPFIRIENVEAAGFGGHGLALGSWNGSTGYRDVRIVRLVAHDNAKSGVLTYGQTRNVHENVYIGYSRTYSNPGDGNTERRNSGSGIVLGAVNGGMIERTLSYGNGSRGWNPNAIWTYDSNNVVIQFNEAYGNRTAGSADGGGFGLDQNVSNSVIQYNYSHGNDGPGLLMAQYYKNDLHAGNVIRYNVSENDGRKLGNSAIKVWGRVRNAEIHNNTIYLSPPPSGQGLPRGISISNVTISTHYLDGLSIRNNIFQTTRSLTLAIVSPSVLRGARNLRFQGNAYFSGGTAFKLKWGATTHRSLSAWRNATSQERIGATAVGLNVDPRLTRPGGGGTIGNADALVSGLGAYRLQSSSSLVNEGLNLASLFSLDPGPRDFYGTNLPQGGAYDVGAHER